ncbi:partial Long-chain-fatty-acid--[acyl-carrier-protein] ligase MbtM, partial [Burkholderiaceae bacterium]
RDASLAQGRAVPAAAGAAPGETLAMMSSGRPIAGAQLRIAGAAGERRVGEIEVRSDSMFGGYLFNADGADTLGADGWLRTGDLGYVAGGELYVTGRSKDLIIRRGHNIYPTDIEEVVAQVEGCKGGRVVAFGIDDPGRGTQDVVVMAERAGPEVDAQSLRCAIRERLLTAMNETPGDVLVCEPNTLRKSTSGKLSRSGNRQLYLERSAARPVPAATDGALPAANALERELQAIWQAALRLPHVPPQARLFAELGADSLAAMQVVGEVRRRFGRTIDAGSLLREDTVRRQARLLQSDAPAADGVLVCLQEGAGRTPLFLVHAASGRAWPYRTLLPHLDTGRPVYAFQAPELFGTPGFLGVDEMAACYLEKMLELQPHGPYLIGGWSFGGAIAHALACRLAAMGKTVQRLVLFDTDPPASAFARWRYRLRQGLLRQAALRGGATAQRLAAPPNASACVRFLAALRPGSESAGELAALMRFACPGRFDGASAAVPAGALWLALRDELAASSRPEETRPFLIAGQDAPTQLHNARVLVKNRRLAVLHTPRQRFPGVIDIVAANDAQRLQGWARHAAEPPRIRAYPVAGTEALAPHFCMFESHNVALFGADLNALLNSTGGTA